MTNRSAARSRLLLVCVVFLLPLGGLVVWRQGRALPARHPVSDAARDGAGGQQLAALKAAVELLERGASAEAVAVGKAAAAQALRAEQPEVRIAAVRLARRPGLDLLHEIVPLLDDPDAEVRRAAMLAVGPERDAIADDDLLRWLHDPDAELRALCEQSLRARGLHEQHLKLGRLLTDHRPGARLQVLDQLRRANDLEPGVWLRRLSHDAAPAVRAAAARAAAEQPFVDLGDRLEQMARDDPSPTVRELAKFYLRAPKSVQKP